MDDEAIIEDGCGQRSLWCLARELVGLLNAVVRCGGRGGGVWV